MSSALRADRFAIVGRLHAVWCLFDVHSIDGRLDGYTLEALDELIGSTGFGAAMVSVGWLEECSDHLCVPRFDEHNGQSAKRRAMDTERKREIRKVSAHDADKTTTREEKRRVDTSLAKAKDEEARKPRPARKCHADFLVTGHMTAWATENAPLVDINKATAAFRDHTFKTAITDWTGAWRNWMRRDQQYAAEKQKPAARRVPARENFDAVSYGETGLL